MATRSLLPDNRRPSQRISVPLAQLSRQLSAPPRERGPAESQSRFQPFIRAVWPELIHGAHHDIMADTFDRTERVRIHPVSNRSQAG